MNDLNSGLQNPNKTPTKQYISIDQAAFDSLSKEVTELKQDFKSQRQESKNIIIGALIALILIVVTVAVEVILFHTRSNQEIQGLHNQYFQKIEELENKFYSKQELSAPLNDIMQTTKIIDCLKFKGYFSQQCF